MNLTCDAVLTKQYVNKEQDPAVKRREPLMSLCFSF